MLWGLLVLFLFSAVVVLGIFYIKDAQLDELLRARILLLVGVLLAVSIAISAFKEKRYITFSLLKSDINEVERLFTTLPKQYRAKYAALSKRIDDQWNRDFFTTNYPQFESSPTAYEEKVLFVSSKNQGASMFMYSLASRLQRKGIPALYCRFEYPLDTEVEIADACGLPSLRILDDAVSNWNKRNLIPYLIIDGLEYVLRTPAFMDVLSKLFQHKVSFIANTEAPDCVQRFFAVINNRQIIVKNWNQPSTGMLERLGGQKSAYDFRTLSLMDGGTQESAKAARKGTSKELASHYDCWDALRKLLAVQRNCRIGQARKEVSMSDLKKLQHFGLIRLTNGRVVLPDRVQPSPVITEY